MDAHSHELEASEFRHVLALETAPNRLGLSVERKHLPQHARDCSFGVKETTQDVVGSGTDNTRRGRSLPRQITAESACDTRVQIGTVRSRHPTPHHQDGESGIESLSPVLSSCATKSEIVGRVLQKDSGNNVSNVFFESEPVLRQSL